MRFDHRTSHRKEDRNDRKITNRNIFFFEIERITNRTSNKAANIHIIIAQHTSFIHVVSALFIETVMPKLHENQSNAVYLTYRTDDYKCNLLCQ